MLFRLFVMREMVEFGVSCTCGSSSAAEAVLIRTVG